MTFGANRSVRLRQSGRSALIAVALPAAKAHGKLVSPAVSALVLAAVLYNAALAILNAHGVRQSFGSVAVCELLILGCGTTYLVLANSIDRTAAGLIGFGLATSAFVTFASDTVSVDCGRSLLLIGLFYVLGMRTDTPLLTTIFRIISALVLAVLILELASTDLYARIFEPASYYANTRGVQEFSVDSSGLFRNALGYQGRFSFGLSSHRTASIFIEQVSLANYAGILGIYLLSLFDRLSVRDRSLHLVTLVLILLTNDTRTSLILSGLSIVGYFVYPLLDAYACLLVMPVIFTSGLVFYTFWGPTGGIDAASDDFRGRVAITMQHVLNFDIGSFFGFNASVAPSLMDSGYCYVIASWTVVGLLVLWLFAAFSVPAVTPAQRRCLFGLNVYFFCNLMIGGTAVFSAKMAAPLWFLVGFMATGRLDDGRMTRGSAGARATRNRPATGEH